MPLPLGGKKLNMFTNKTVFQKKILRARFFFGQNMPASGKHRLFVDGLFKKNANPLGSGGPARRGM